MKEQDNLNRYKGLFVNGNPKKVNPPKKNGIVFHNGKLEINCAGFNRSGWIPPKNGAL